LRLRRLVLLLLGVVGVYAALRHRRPSEYVDVQFEDGSSFRFAGGTDARDLLDDVYGILDAVR
jgi:hypothetical protein